MAAIFGYRALAPRLAERAIEAVERDEGQAVHADQPRHRGHVVLRGQQLFALRQLGGKRLRQPLTAVRQYQPPRMAPVQAKAPKIRDRVARRAFRPRLLLVGKRVDEAIELTAAFLDDGLLHGAEHLEIVHGAGEGILRRAIREFLAGRREVAAFRPADLAEGGDNVTMVELKGR